MVFLTDDADLTAMSLHHLIDIVESKSEAWDAAFAVLLVNGCPAELIEDDVLVLFRDADAIVAYLQQYVFIRTVTGDADFDLVFLVFDGIVNQIWDSFR